MFGVSVWVCTYVRREHHVYMYKQAPTPTHTRNTGWVTPILSPSPLSPPTHLELDVAGGGDRAGGVGEADPPQHAGLLEEHAHSGGHCDGAVRVAAPLHLVRLVAHLRGHDLAPVDEQPPAAVRRTVLCRVAAAREGRNLQRVDRKDVDGAHTALVGAPGRVPGPHGARGRPDGPVEVRDDRHV